MKKYSLLFLLAAGLGFSSCSDEFLTATSPDKIVIEEYYKTEARIFEALVAAYDPLQWPDWNGSEYNPALLITDMMADDILVGGSNATDNQGWHMMFNYNVNSERVVAGVWKCYYNGINRSNNVIDYMQYVENISPEKEALFIAEAKVLRAYYYTYLWKMWGNIPYYTKNLEFPYTGQQFKANDVYSSIIADLDDAIANGGLPMKADALTYGRVTKAMAYMLYAEAVMYQKDESRYSSALNYMTQIIDSKQYDLHPDFAEIFEDKGEWCKESIWEINFRSEGSVRSWNGPLVSGGTCLPRLISPHSWVVGVDGLDSGWGFGPVRTEAYEMYEDGDTRREGTIFDARKGSYNERYQNTGFWLNKYIARVGYADGQLADADLNWNNNLRIYRYSETLLNAAELIRLGAGAGDADGYLAQVRERAGVAPIAATIDNIINERRLEFVGEGKRYWDLIRSGKAAATLRPDAEGYRTNNWSESKKYLPIPQKEIDASQGVLTQNNY